MYEMWVQLCVYEMWVNSVDELKQKVVEVWHCLHLCTVICTHIRAVVRDDCEVLALDLEGVHDLKLHHPSSSVATSNQ